MTEPLSGYRLLHEGSVALSQVEANGIRIDTDYLVRTRKEIRDQIRDLEDGLRKDPVYQAWRKRFGAKTQLGSRQQLGTVVFDVLGHPRKDAGPALRSRDEDDESSEGENAESAFSHLDLDFVRSYFRCEKLKKLRSTYLTGVAREVCDGFLHPSFNLHTTVTMRSSSDKPNFQNIPIRNPEIAAYIRRAFVARATNQLLEVDFSGAEVRVSCCYHKDPRMIKEFTEPGQDPHGYTAMQLFSLTQDQVDKRTTRDWSKNRFVFPQFYGSVFFQCAPHIWEAVSAPGAKLPDGTPLLKHLNRNGVKGLGTLDAENRPSPQSFYQRVKEVENDFWNQRFVVYTRWKKTWYDAYLRKGYFDTLTGFRLSGVYRRNQVLNYPIQGSAFHCLLWTLIKMQRWLTKKRFKTKIVGQIHDSMLMDVHPKELQDVLAKVHRLITRDLPRAWKWICVPIEAEAELSPVGGTWHDKKKVPFE